MVEEREKVKEVKRAEEDRRREERAVIEEERALIRNKIITEKKQRVIDVLARQTSFDPQVHDFT